MIELTDMISEPAKNSCPRESIERSRFYRLPLLLLFALFCQLLHVLLYLFPKRDPLAYLHILHDWNAAGSFAPMLEKYPKFGLLLFSFLPLKWAEKAGIPLYPASIIWMVLMSLISVYALYQIVLLLTGDERKAMWTGALLAIHPMIMLYAGNLLRDTPYLMFCLLHILVFIHAVRKKQFIFFLLTGATLAMCLLSRFESGELLVLFPSFSIFCMIRKKFEKRAILLWIAGAAAGFFGTILLMLSAVDDLSLLYMKGKMIFLSYFPVWMRL